jgi:hypothetical protein
MGHGLGRVRARHSRFGFAIVDPSPTADGTQTVVSSSLLLSRHGQAIDGTPSIGRVKVPGNPHAWYKRRGQ